jgi:hypothetical protein
LQLLTLPQEHVLGALHNPRVLQHLVAECHRSLSPPRPLSDPSTTFASVGAAGVGQASSAAAAVPTPASYRGYTVDQVAGLMGQLHLPAQPFVENAVDGSQLVDLDMDTITKVRRRGRVGRPAVPHTRLRGVGGMHRTWASSGCRPSASYATCTIRPMRPRRPPSLTRPARRRPWS